MYGIVGFYLPNSCPDLALLRRMNATLVYRGPDGEEYFTDGPIGLATRYLPYSTDTQPISQRRPNHFRIGNCRSNGHLVGG